jgi:hypothetical protein
VTAEKAALSQWLRAQTTMTLRWVSERLRMGHYSNAGRGPKKMKAEDLQRLRQATAKLASLNTEER